MNSRSDGGSLDWSGAERYQRYYQRMEKVSPSHVRGPTFQTFYRQLKWTIR